MPSSRPSCSLSSAFPARRTLDEVRQSRSAAPTHAIADHVIALGKTIATVT
jgi:hypothetical protein